MPLMPSGDALVAFLLVFFRMTGVTLSAPFFSNRSFPVRLRVFTALLIAAVCFPVVVQRTSVGDLSGIFAQPVAMALAVGSELAVGWALGFVASVMVWAAQLAGHILDQEIGLSIGEVFDPVSGAQGSPSAQLFLLMGILAFVLLDGHHLVVYSVTRSFDAVPLGEFPFTATTGEYLARDVGGSVWTLGLRLAAPGMVGLLLVTVAMAILARVVPEMNIFILGFAVRIACGLGMALLLLPFVADLFRVSMFATRDTIDHFLTLLAGG